MNYKLIILDFDGTIADTRNSILTTVKETLKNLGMPLTLDKDEEIQKLIGLPLKTTFQKIAGLEGNTLEKVIKEYRTIYDEVSLRTVSLFSGVKETLENLHSKGLKISVASSKGKKSLNNLLKNLGISHLMSFIAGEQDVKNKKPAPDMVNLILANLNINPKNTLVIGDMIYDIQMGQTANCFTCGVTYGNGTIEELQKSNPTFIINNFSELLRILENKNAIRENKNL